MSATPGNTTRQQLDELDALLQRMLALPIGQPPESAAAPPTPEVPSRPPPALPPPPPPAPPTFAPRPTTPLPSDPGRAWTVDLPATPPTARTASAWAGNSAGMEAFHVRTSAPVPAGNDRFNFSGAEAAMPHGPAIAPAPPSTVPAPTVPAASERVPIGFWPLVGLNAVLVLPFGLLGPLGQLLTGRRGRTFLGAVGLLSLAAAASWLALDWFGWTW